MLPLVKWSNIEWLIDDAFNIYKNGYLHLWMDIDF